MKTTKTTANARGFFLNASSVISRFSRRLPSKFGSMLAMSSTATGLISKIRSTFMFFGDRFQARSNLSPREPSIKSGSYRSFTDNNTYQYHTIGIVGRGSFGVVYSAINSRGNAVAVKTKKRSPDPNQNTMTTKFFDAELSCLSGLVHPNITLLLGVENRNLEIDSIVLEYVHGENLDAMVTRNQGLPESVIRTFTKQIFNAIHFIHSKGIIHRDIKSGNIMITSSYQVKLMDFGMAKRVTNAFALQDDSNQAVVGTLAYMAPELTKFEYYDARVDIWSLGVVVFEMGNGEPFYRTEKVTYSLNTLPSSISLINLSPTANNFIQSCIIKNFKMRPSVYTLASHPFLKQNN